MTGIGWNGSAARRRVQQVDSRGATLISSAGDVVEELATALGILPVSTNAEYPVSQEPPTSLSSEETAVYGALADGTLL